MNLSYSLKNYSWQQLARPMLLLSVGIHGLLLFIPMPIYEVETVEKEKTQDQVKITQLPISDSPKVSKKSTTSSAVKAPINRQNNSSTINQNVISPATKPSSQIKSSSQTTKTTPQAIAPSKEVATLPNPDNLDRAFGDFPKYINSQPGSLGLFQAPLDQTSQQTKDALATVAQYFERELKAREYNVISAKNEPNIKVFEVTKNNTTKFLNLIAHNGGTVIVLASEILTPENLTNVAKASPQEEAFIRILDRINFENIDQPDLYLSDPSLFYSKFGEGKDGFYEVEQKSNTISTIRLIPNQLPEQVFNTIFASTLKSSGFEVNLQGQYGGGNVYLVKQGSFVAYLNLVPTADRQSTVVVSWSSTPN